MPAQGIYVLKQDQFREGLPVRLPSGQRPAAPGPGGAEGSGRPSGPAQVRIVESNSDYVILEIICGCGQKSFVQCNYGNVSGSQEKQETRP